MVVKVVVAVVFFEWEGFHPFSEYVRDNKNVLIAL